MNCHIYTHLSKKERNKGKCHHPASVPSHFKNVEFRDGMGLKLGNGISPCFFTSLKGGVYDKWTLETVVLPCRTSKQC